MGLLPTNKSIKKNDNPRNLIMFGLPKVGKTTVLSQLPDCLIIDLENGSDYIEGFSVKASNYKELQAIARALRDEEHHFKFVALDTVTALEEMAMPVACKLYQDTPMGKNWDGDNVLKLPNGQGYYYIRLAVEKMISWFRQSAENIILVGHVKDKSLTEGGTELNVKTLDLGGKLSNILSAQSDAICYLYRDVTNGNLMANFGDMNSVLCGARVPHLAGKTILLAERKQLDDGNYDIVAHWDNIYPSLKDA